MKLNQIKNDGVFEKKDSHLAFSGGSQENYGYNKAKAELSEVELVMDDKYLLKFIQGIIKDYAGDDVLCDENDGEEYIEAIASSMSEWLRLNKKENNIMCDQRKMTVEEVCSELRKEIETLKGKVCFCLDELKFMETQELEGNNIPKSSCPNMGENLTLTFRHLEDARMRLGKVMQAYQGGISILDKK